MPELPLLLRRKQVLELTGLHSRDLSAAVRAGAIKAIRPRATKAKRGKAKYITATVLQYCQL